MKLCPQCEFIYEDDQSFCDMDGKELVNNPSPFAFEESVPAKSAQLDDDRRAAGLTLTPSLTPGLMPSPVGAPASLPVNLVSRRQPRNLAVAALAGLVLMALLFVVYYARTRQSHTRNANRPSGQSNSQSSQPATQSADTQPSAPDSGSESAQSPGETTASDQPFAQPLEQSSDQSSAEAGSPDLTPPTAQTSHALPPASEKSLLRGRATANPVSARASSETSRASVVIRLTNGATIKADEAWEKREGIWYRQAGMVTFLKRSRVRSIQRLAPSNRTQMEARPQTSIAQNQPRVGKPEIVQPKKESKMTSFLKKTGRILKKPFKF